LIDFLKETYLWRLWFVGLIQSHIGTTIENTESSVKRLELIVLEIGMIFGYIVQFNRELMICNNN